MRIVLGLLAIIVVLVAVAIPMRRRDRGAAAVLLVFAGVFAVLLVGAFFGLV